VVRFLNTEASLLVVDETALIADTIFLSVLVSAAVVELTQDTEDVRFLTVARAVSTAVVELITAILTLRSITFL
jgi:hypothetical protein